MPSNRDNTTSSFPLSSNWLSSAMGRTWARPVGCSASAIPVTEGPCPPRPARYSSWPPRATPCPVPVPSAIPVTEGWLGGWPATAPQLGPAAAPRAVLPPPSAWRCLVRSNPCLGAGAARLRMLAMRRTPGRAWASAAGAVGVAAGSAPS
eukprot:6600184-Alexandrium_andersonii.AAC.1